MSLSVALFPRAQAIKRKMPNNRWLFTLFELTVRMATMNEEKKNYEICFLLKSEPEKEDILAAIGRYHLEIIDDGQLSRIRLAYPISKEKFAYFGYLRFKSDPQDI